MWKKVVQLWLDSFMYSEDCNVENENILLNFIHDVCNSVTTKM